MDCELIIEYHVDAENPSNNMYVVWTENKDYKDITGLGQTISEAIKDFDKIASVA